MLGAPGAREGSQVFSPERSPVRPHSEQEQSQRALVPSSTKTGAHLGKPAHQPLPTSASAKQNRRRHTHEHPPRSEPTSERMRRPGEAWQPSRGYRHLHSAHSLRTAWLPRHRKTPWQQLSRIPAPRKNKGNNCLASNAFPFQSLASGSSAGSGPCLSLPVAFRSATVGSCVRCRRFRHAPGEGTRDTPLCCQQRCW